MEFYKGHLIAYSLGNFAGYHALTTTGPLGISMILRVTHARGRLVRQRERSCRRRWSPPACRGWTRPERAIPLVRSLTEGRLSRHRRDDQRQRRDHATAYHGVTAPTGRGQRVIHEHERG